MYKFIAYPRWLYHATEAPRVVADYEAEEALGDGWAPHPDLVPAPAVAAPATDAVETPARKKRK